VILLAEFQVFRGLQGHPAAGPSAIQIVDVEGGNLFWILIWHPRSQYPEPRNHARSRVLSIPPAPWRYPSDRPKAEARRRRCLNHRTNGATAEDSNVDAVAGMRRDKDFGATAFE
jgi:hypothetical protein